MSIFSSNTQKDVPEDVPGKLSVNQQSWEEAAQLEKFYNYQQSKRYLEDATTQVEVLSHDLQRAMAIQVKAEDLHELSKKELRKVIP